MGRPPSSTHSPALQASSSPQLIGVSTWPVESQMPTVTLSMQRGAPGEQTLQLPVCALQAAGEPQSITGSKPVRVALQTSRTAPLHWTAFGAQLGASQRARAALH